MFGESVSLRMSRLMRPPPFMLLLSLLSPHIPLSPSISFFLPLLPRSLFLCLLPLLLLVLLLLSLSLPPVHPPVRLHYRQRASTAAPPATVSPVTLAADPATEVPSYPYTLRDHSTLLSPHRFAAASISVSGVVEPRTYREAIQSPKWRVAMTEELDALARTQTWDLVSLLAHAVPITCRWIYKMKTYSDGSIERYKAHLVARGF